MAITFSYECKNPLNFPKAFLYRVDYLAKIVNASERVIEAAVQKPNPDKFKYWFGDFHGSHGATFEKSKVHVEAMLEHARSHPIIFNQISQTTLCKTNQQEGELKLNLGTYLSMGIYSLGELVVTLTHELSHKTPNLMTKDIVIGRSDDGPSHAYRTEAVKLARKDPAKAFQNAENWGYYLASYHEEADLSSWGSWENTQNETEIGKKPLEPKSGDPVRGEHWGGGYWVMHKGERCGCVPDGANKAIVRYRVTGNNTTLDRAQTALDGESATVSPVVATHVKKAPVDDGPHKCPQCHRGFMTIVAKFEHQRKCSQQ